MMNRLIKIFVLISILALNPMSLYWLQAQTMEATTLPLPLETESPLPTNVNDEAPQTQNTPVNNVGKDVSCKDYFPAITGKKYTYEFLEASKKGASLKNRIIECVKTETDADGITHTTFHTKVFFNSLSPVNETDDNYLIDENAVEDTSQYSTLFATLLGKGDTYTPGNFIVKLPSIGKPLEWDYETNSGEKHELISYFGSTKTKNEIYNDCIVVEERAKSSKAKMTSITKYFYAKNVGLVKSELHFIRNDGTKLFVKDASSQLVKVETTE
jgi:hypothetical protein